VDFIGYSFEPEDRLRKNREFQHGYTLPEGDFCTSVGEQQFYNSNLSVQQKIRAMGYRGRFFIWIFMAATRPAPFMSLATKTLPYWLWMGSANLNPPHSSKARVHALRNCDI
jgi:hypothetical protein